MRTSLLLLALACLSTASAIAQSACPPVGEYQTFDSLHLSGATLYRPEPDIDNYGNLYPEEIVLLKDGLFFRRIKGESFHWSWMFWNKGQEIAADTSPLHFMQVFSLTNIQTGKEVATYAIPQDPNPPPDWVKALQAKQAHDAAIQRTPIQDCRFRPSSKTHPETR